MLDKWPDVQTAAWPAYEGAVSKLRTSGRPYCVGSTDQGNGPLPFDRQSKCGEIPSHSHADRRPALTMCPHGPESIVRWLGEAGRGKRKSDDEGRLQRGLASSSSFRQLLLALSCAKGSSTSAFIPTNIRAIQNIPRLPC